MEDYIKEKTKENFQLIRLEGGHTITQESMENAKVLVLNYWRKLKSVIEKVTQAEVPLILPEQVTPEGRKFTLQGVVDVVTDESGTWIYDIKTVDVDSIHDNIEFYKAQLSVYAYVWKKLKNKSLDGCAIIAVGMTKPLRKAIKTEDQDEINRAIAAWNPVVKVEINEDSIEEAIQEFGKIVDKIESCDYTARPAKELGTHQQITGNSKTFAENVCNNCDIRFSCDSYQEYKYSFSS